jgi:hypothetical protein
MSQIALNRSINPALFTEILDNEGFVAFWYRDGGTCRVVTDAPYAVVASALVLVGAL